MSALVGPAKEGLDERLAPIGPRAREEPVALFDDGVVVDTPPDEIAPRRVAIDDEGDSGQLETFENDVEVSARD